jgi:16S rRNA (guanine966-N2)-methyltransferase
MTSRGSAGRSAPRILGGELRGRALAVPDGLVTRPLRARARKSLFDVLGPSIEGATVLDLYAGAGTVGLEAVSRGAALAVLVDDGRAAARAIAASVEALGVAARVRFVARDALSFVQEEGAADRRYDLIYLGPPYRLFQPPDRDRLDRVLEGAAGLLARAGTLVLETPGRVPLPSIPHVSAGESRRYGDTSLHFFRPAPSA